MKLVQKILKIVLPLLFGVGIFWFLTSKVDFAEVHRIVEGNISWGWVAVSLFIGLLSHVARGLRWRLQIVTLGANPSVHDMSVSVFGNYGLNLLFPRLGEVWRCNYISQVGGVQFSTVLGTMLSERIVDIIASIIIALVAFAFEQGVFVALIDEKGIGGGLVEMLSSSWFYVASACLVALIVLCRRYLSDTTAYHYVEGVCKNIGQGIMSLKELPNKWTYFFYTVLIWGLYYLNTYTGLFFFDFTSHFSPIEALLIFIMGSMSLIVPVQGGLGAWHAMIIFTLGCYGIDETKAFSFAMVHWFIQEGFVLLLGLYALVAVAFKNKK